MAGLGIVLFLLPIALGSFVMGHIINGWDSPDIQCSHEVNRVPIPVETEGEVGGWSNFPLGLACTVDVPDDGVPSQTVVHADWPATIVWVLSSAGLIVGFVLLVRPQQK